MATASASASSTATSAVSSDSEKPKAAQIEDTDSTQWTRVQCPDCQGSFKYFCPHCCHALGVPPTIQVPTPTLPLQVDIWFQDKIKKSTAPHAKVLAPNQVNIVPFVSPEAGRFKRKLPNDTSCSFQPPPQQQPLPEYDPDQVLVVYPTNDATTLAEMPLEVLKKVTTLVFIDSPWQKAPVILQSSSLSQLRCVKLAKPPVESQFWRYHQAGAGCVSTIEAIHLMLVEYLEAMQQQTVSADGDVNKTDFAVQRHQVDQLLFFFNLLHSQIVQSYHHNQPSSTTTATLDQPDETCIQDPSRIATSLPTGPLPMSAEAKERRRQIRDQKEAGRKRKLENRRKHWESLRAAQEQSRARGQNDFQMPRNGRCYNCKESDHEAKYCPNPCRYCKQTGHWSGGCTFKKLRYEEEQTRQSRPFTQALD